MQMDTKVNMLAWEQTGCPGIGACNVERGGPYENSVGNASKFRGVSRVRAFYRDPDTLPDTEGELSRLFVHLGLRILNVFTPKQVHIYGATD